MEHSTKTLRLLYIDNQSLVAKALKHCFQYYDVHVDIFQDSREALAVLKSGPYDLVICDVDAEPLNAYAFCKDVQQTGRPEQPSLRILLTGFEEPDLEEFVALKNPNLFFIPKYSKIEQWIEKIETIV